MKNILIDYFLRHTKLTETQIEALKESMIIKTYPKGEHLLQEGQFNSDTFFVLKGLVRQYKLTEGNDITTNFYPEEQWIISLDDNENSAANYNLLCMEDTSVVVGNEEKAMELFKQFPELAQLSGKVMESVFIEQQKSINTYITSKPEQRYLSLMQEHPDLLQRIPQYDIASYIGVKPETLSRIRKKML